MSKEKRSLLLMHPLRRSIYQIISETPGSYFFEIASALELPHGTVSWHLKKLEESGLIGTMRFAGRRIFFSQALRTSDVEKAFAILKSEATQEVFIFILNNPGCYQAQIAEALGHHHDTVRHHIQRLKKVDLIESYREGRNVIYRLGAIGNSILDSNTEVISKAYIEHLFSILKEECLTPELIEHGEGKVTIRISCPGKDDVYLSIELKGWEFISEEEATIAFPSAKASTDINEESELRKTSQPDLRSSRPRVVRLDDD